MKGGHNKIPEKVKKMRGTSRKDRSNPKAPKAETAKVPPPPRELKAVQKRVWAELAVQVEQLGVFSPSDLTAFRLMVETVAETRAFDPRDPATARVRTRQVAAGLLQRFGLDPASKSKVAAVDREDKPDEDDVPIFGAPLRAIAGGQAPGTGGDGD